MKKNRQKQTLGIALLEVVVAAAIISVGTLAFISSYLIYFNYALANSGNVQAAYLEEEGLELMSYFRDQGWTANIYPLSTTTIYYLAFNPGGQTTSAPQYIDGTFLREITLDDVFRDANSKIVNSGGTFDPNTKLVTVTVQYFQGHGTTTKSVSSYITNVNQD